MPGTRRVRTLTRLAALPVAALMLTAACAADQAPPSVPVKAQGQLVTAVPDSADDAGRGSSVGLDPDGNPAVTYLMLQPVLKKGQIPPPIIAGQPQPPAVMLATGKDGQWTRTSVTKQSTTPAKGEATGIATAKGQAGPAVDTSLVIDGQGKHHVAWSAADGLYYSTDAAGSFGDPEKVVNAATLGASLSVASDGTPWISFYEGSSVKLAHKAGTNWAVEDVSSAAVPAAAARTSVALSSKGPVVAYGAGDSTWVARKTGGSWSGDGVPGPGGYGVSLALDKDGNPHVAFYSKDGHAFHAHSISGSPWKVDDLGLAGTTTAPNANWGTDIALDDSGVHYIAVADPATGTVKIFTNKGGAFSPTDVPNSAGGADPNLAVSGDGTDLALSFFDTVNANVVVATPPAAGLLLAYSPPAAATTPPPTQPSAAGCQPSGTTIDVTAKNVAFDKDCLAAPAGKAFEIVFKNDDTGIPHNVEVFTDSSATTRLAGAKDPSDIVTGPDTATYKSDPLKAGVYFFHCDIHPNMQGQFVVA